MKNKKILLLLFLVAIYGLITYQPVWATQTASPSSDVDPELIKQKLKERLEDNVQGVSDTDQKSLPISAWFGTFGTVTEVKTNEILIETAEKQRMTILFTDDTEISLLKGGRATPLEMEDIEEKWFAIAMGTKSTESNTIQAKRLSLTEKVTPNPTRKTYVGKVSEIDEDILTITNGKDHSFDIPKQYDLNIKGVKKPELDDISIDDKAVLIALEILDEEDKEATPSYQLKSLFIVPSINNPLSTGVDETASASATPSGSVKSSKP